MTYIKILNRVTNINFRLYLLPLYDNMILFCRSVCSTQMRINVLWVATVRCELAGAVLLASCGRCAVLHSVKTGKQLPQKKIWKAHEDVQHL